MARNMRFMENDHGECKPTTASFLHLTALTAEGGGGGGEGNSHIKRTGVLIVPFRG